MGVRTKECMESIAIHGILIPLVPVCVFPVPWMCLILVKDISESISGWNSLWVNNPTLDNYRRLFSMIPIWKNASNSVFITILETVMLLLFRSLARFAFAKYKFPGRNALFYFVIVTMLVPPEVGAVPLFIIMKKLNLADSLWSLIILRIATAVGIFYIHQYIMGISGELIEAVHIDGRGDSKILTSIIISVIKPALVSWASVTLIARQDDFFWSLLYLRKQAKYTLMVSTSLLPVNEGLFMSWLVTLAGTTLVIIPAIVLYLLLQTLQKVGLTAGAVKG